MYSKYLDYTETATKSHQHAREESDQKDIIISQLKREIYQLKQLEGDYARLNSLIEALEDKYSLLLSEKQRNDKDQRTKSDIDQKTIIDLREEINDHRVELQKSILFIEEILRDNTNLKKQCDARSGEIQNIRFQLKEITNKNQRGNDDNRNIALYIRGLKEERKRLEESCEHLSALLDASLSELKQLEKEVRNTESTNARLENTLYQAEKDKSKLQVEYKEKGEDVRKNEQKLKAISNSITQIGVSCRNLEQQSVKSRDLLQRNNAILNSEIKKGDQLQSKIAYVETAIRTQQNDLDLIIAEEEKLRKEHFAALDRNKDLNSEIDKTLALIAEYELVNHDLLDQISMFIDQDEQAKSMLSRKEIMQEIIQSSMRKIAATEFPIKHLKC